ncbi:hypothetical protein PR048_027936 [Dryococelus australis]|uniref:Uncharacterized protein n=1 Tax=Dryococelus australis TaxID=614101 RepID=A0ABQ9GHX4_9NEOP|nr:hypothetical protein PR048_027936 [Dryococelus australis]
MPDCCGNRCQWRHRRIGAAHLGVRCHKVQKADTDLELYNTQPSCSGMVARKTQERKERRCESYSDDSHSVSDRSSDSDLVNFALVSLADQDAACFYCDGTQERVHLQATNFASWVTPPEAVFQIARNAHSHALALGNNVRECCSKCPSRARASANNRDAGRGKWEIPEKTRRPAESPGTIPTCENPRAIPQGIQPVLHCWEASEGQSNSSRTHNEEESRSQRTWSWPELWGHSMDRPICDVVQVLGFPRPTCQESNVNPWIRVKQTPPGSTAVAYNLHSTLAAARTPARLQESATTRNNPVVFQDIPAIKAGRSWPLCRSRTWLSALMADRTTCQCKDECIMIWLWGFDFSSVGRFGGRYWLQMADMHLISWISSGVMLLVAWKASTIRRARNTCSSPGIYNTRVRVLAAVTSCSCVPSTGPSVRADTPFPPERNAGGSGKSPA